MADIRRLQLQRLFGHLGEVAYELTNVQFSRCSTPETWYPAINAYRCATGIVVCVELAGVDRSQLDVQVESGRVRIRGQRQPPEPRDREQEVLQVLAMEIDYGPFEREVALPAEVEPERVTAEQRNGLLWIFLPLRSQA